MSSRPSPLPNRVTPWGGIEAHPARGTLMGNRGGRLHDGFALVRHRAGRRWIACALCFRGRRRTVMGTGYTELFFLDEAVALAAGHRPCFECRRDMARAFAAGWGAATGTLPPGADAMDQRLDVERGRPWTAPALALPTGAMFARDGHAWLVLGTEALLWQHDGYADRRHIPAAATVTVLTPPITVAVLAGGYRPALHPSAGAARPPQAGCRVRQSE